MKLFSYQYRVWLLFLPLISFPALLFSQIPLDSHFTYQGLIKKDGSPYTGTCDLTFTLYSDESTATAIGSPFNASNTSVNNGLFTVHLEFGSPIFNGTKRWLEVQSKCPAGNGIMTVLGPRQELTSAPHAAYALQAGSASSSVTFSGSLGGDVTGTQGSASVVQLRGQPVSSTPPTLTGQVLKWDGSKWGPGTDDNTTSFWSLTGNQGTNPASQFIGTVDNTPFELRVNNARALRIEPNSSPNIIGGYSANSSDAGVVGVKRHFVCKLRPTGRGDENSNDTPSSGPHRPDIDTLILHRR